MKCSFCGSLISGRPPTDWRVLRGLVLCPECRHRRFRRKRLTMAVAEPVGAEWREFNAVFSEALGQATLLPVPNEGWQLTMADGQPLAHVSIRHRWWALRLRSSGWSRGRKAVYERIASGEALAGEFLLFRRRIVKEFTEQAFDLFCKTAVWLPSDLPDAAGAVVRAPSTRLPRVRREQNIEEISLARLRAAVRTNRISFPSQVPAFPGCGQPDLQRKLVQLYFVLGWSGSDIGARYGLTPQRVQLALNAWKLRAARAGYLQHITEPTDEPAAASFQEEQA